MTTTNVYTIPPTQDRSYYRGLTTNELLTVYREALPERTNWHELAIVLAERLKAEINERPYDCPNCDY